MIQMKKMNDTYRNADYTFLIYTFIHITYIYIIFICGVLCILYSIVYTKGTMCIKYYIYIVCIYSANRPSILLTNVHCYYVFCQQKGGGEVMQFHNSNSFLYEYFILMVNIPLIIPHYLHLHYFSSIMKEQRRSPMGHSQSSFSLYLCGHAEFSKQQILWQLIQSTQNNIKWIKCLKGKDNICDGRCFYIFIYLY